MGCGEDGCGFFAFMDVGGGTDDVEDEIDEDEEEMDEVETVEVVEEEDEVRSSCSGVCGGVVEIGWGGGVELGCGIDNRSSPFTWELTLIAT